jgi:multiple sugar transport system permease protein
VSAAATLPRVRDVERRRRRLLDARPYLFLLPALAVLALFVYRPLAEALRLSFYQWNLMPTTPQRFVGLDNYRRVLALPDMQQAVFNTVVVTLGLLPFSVLLPLGVALLTDGLAGRLRQVYRALIFLPVVVAPVVAAVVWSWLLDPDHGLVDAALAALGVHPVAFLGDKATALATIIGITGWKLVGFSTLIIAAALAGLDRALFEAARIDGAGPWRIVRAVTLPLLSPTLLFLTLLTVLLGAQWSFVYVNVLTEGGPLGATTNIYYLLWDYAFNTFSIGWSAAAGMLLFVVFALLAAAGLYLSDRLAFHHDD